MAGNGIQVGSADGRIRVKTNGIVVAGDDDACCCEQYCRDTVKLTVSGVDAAICSTCQFSLYIAKYIKITSLAVDGEYTVPILGSTFPNCTYDTVSASEGSVGWNEYSDSDCTVLSGSGSATFQVYAAVSWDTTQWVVSDCFIKDATGVRAFAMGGSPIAFGTAISNSVTCGQGDCSNGGTVIVEWT